MRRSRPEDYLGIDVGAAHVGIARGSGAARLAEPIKSVPAAAAIEEIIALAGQYRTAGVVVGLPRGLDGQDTAQTEYVRDWAAAASQRIRLPFFWQDEALTSQKAGGLKLVAKSSADEHARAAAIILQDFLDTPESDRVAG